MLKSEEARLRREAITLELDKLGFATVRQLRVICDLKGERNASKVLLTMERMKYINSIKKEYKVFYVANKGREIIGSNSEPRTGQMEHTLMRNDLYIKLGMPDSWDTEVPIQLSQDEQMRVDAMYMKGGEYHFVEVDYHTSMKRNQEKMERYKRIKSFVFQQFNHHPTVIWYTVSETRKQRLEEWMREYGIKGSVFV